MFYRKHHSCITIILIVISAVFFLTACGEGSPSSEVTVTSSKTAPGGMRSSEAVVLVPVPGDSALYGNKVVTIDASNAAEGYLMVNYKGNNSKVKLQLTGSNQITYTYTLPKGYTCLPLTSDSGTYRATVYENISEDQYATAFADDFEVTIKNKLGPYLYPNEYVNFSKDSKAVAQAVKLAEGASCDLDVVASVYEYVTANITYDHEKAATVDSGYLPSVDKILSEKKGICFDYAAVMAAMLRSQRIPTRLEVGYAGDAYHAWVSTYIKDSGWINGIIKFDGKDWTLMDPTFAANSSEKALKNFIGDGSNYVTKYVY